MPRVYFHTLITFFLLCGWSIAQAQEEESDFTTQYWFDITLFNEFSNKIEFYGDGGYRRITNIDIPWDRLYVRPAVKYRPLPWLSLRAGLGLIFTDYDAEDISNRFEVRPWQGLSIGWPKLPRFKFSHYFRLEQRYTYRINDNNRSYAQRFRYQISTRFQPNINKKVKYVYFPGFIEFFADLSDQENSVELFKDEIRVGGGIGYTINNYWSGEFILFLQRTGVEAGGFRTTDMIFRFKVRHELVPARDMQRTTE